MKKIISSSLVAVLGFSGVQVANTYALSCLDPQSMIEFYVNDDDYTVFTATAGETKEHIKEPADPSGTDPNMQFNSGYTGQYVTVTKAYKGYPEAMQWVYFEKNATWGYLCSSGPANSGEETLYILNSSNGLFELPQVVNAYPADSELAQQIIEALQDNEIDNAPTISEVTAEDWMNRLRTDIIEMVFVIKIKLSEFWFWSRQ